MSDGGGGLVMVGKAAALFDAETRCADAAALALAGIRKWVFSEA